MIGVKNMLKSNIIVNNNKIYLMEYDIVNHTILTSVAIYYLGDDIKINWTAIMDAPIIMQLTKGKYNRKVNIELTNCYYEEIKKINYHFKEKEYHYFMILKDKKPLVLKSPYCMTTTRYLMTLSKDLSDYSIRINFSEIEQHYVQNCIKSGQYLSLVDILMKEHKQLVQQTLTLTEKGDVK